MDTRQDERFKNKATSPIDGSAVPEKKRKKTWKAERIKMRKLVCKALDALQQGDILQAMSYSDSAKVIWAELITNEVDPCLFIRPVTVLIYLRYKICTLYKNEYIKLLENQSRNISEKVEEEAVLAIESLQECDDEFLEDMHQVLPEIAEEILQLKPKK